jgi:hypothetical protein
MASPKTPSPNIIPEGHATGANTRLRRRWMTGGSGHAQLLKAHISKTVKKEVKKHLKFNNSPKKPSPKKPSPSVVRKKSPSLKYRLKLIQKLANNRTRRSENNAREIRRLIQNQQRIFRRNIINQNSLMRRGSYTRGRPTSYFNSNFHRYYQGQAGQYYYYPQPGIPQYVPQLPRRVWKLNQGGAGLPFVPFFIRRR